MKKRKTYNLIAVLLAIVMIVPLIIIPKISVKCETAKLTELKPDQVYTTLDVTGDGKKDRFKVQRPKLVGKGRPYYKSFTISVNGKTAYQFKTSNGKGFYNLNPILITLGNGKRYLFITCGNGDTYESFLTAVFQYKRGKFVKVIDFDQYCKRHTYSWIAWPISVNGNRINFDMQMYSCNNPNLGYYEGSFTMQFVYQSGTLKQNSSAAFVNNGPRKIRIGKNIWAYTTTDRVNNAFKLLEGDIVTYDQLRISSTRMLLRVKKGTRYGWILLGKGVIAF